MVAYVLNHNETFLIHANDPVWNHYPPFKWWLLPHGIAGACALLLAPMQFSDRLRKKYAKLHRVVGRFYIAGVFVAGPLGFYIQFFQERSGATRSFSVAGAVDATLWMTTTAIALLFILRGNVNLHRQWMTRSFAVAIVFLEVRVIGGITGWDMLGPRAMRRSSGFASPSRSSPPTSFCSGTICEARVLRHRTQECRFPKRSLPMPNLRTSPASSGPRHWCGIPASTRVLETSNSLPSTLTRE